ncbi:hypothetical protein J7E28_09105 [Microbacterium sp. ISL-108]|nr:hypothetical protein [Microbacterium sp. ISL-108]
MKANDLCATHASQRYFGHELHPIRGRISCPVPDCEGTYTAKSSIEFCAKHTRVLRLYGLTPERLMQMYVAGSVCELCGDRTKTAIDHDHACCAGEGSCGECVRGTLCLNCNHMLGSARDSPEVLRAAIAYLQSHAERSLRLAA